MFEIVLLIVATSGIAALARTRGGQPWLWGMLMVAGYVIVPGIVSFFAVVFGADPNNIKVNAQLWFYVSAITWVAVLFFCARFVLGRGYAQPGGMWSCPNCKYLNKEYAVICEACQRPYRQPLPFM